MNKILLIFIFYVVAAASFNGFFTKWNFRDIEGRYSFAAMYAETAERPFVHRQLMITVAKEIKFFMPEESQQNLIKYFKYVDLWTEYSLQESFISRYYVIIQIQKLNRNFRLSIT